MVEEKRSHHTQEHHHHVDESEMYRDKTLLSAKIRKKWAHRCYILLVVVAIVVMAACAWSYFFDR